MPEIYETVTLRAKLTLTEFLIAAGVPDAPSYRAVNGTETISVDVVIRDYMERKSVAV